jgi:hypothetical protein
MFKWHDKKRPNSQQKKYDTTRDFFIMHTIENKQYDLLDALVKNDKGDYDDACYIEHLKKAFQMDDPKLVKIVWRGTGCTEEGDSKILFDILIKNAKKNNIKIIKKCEKDRKFLKDTILCILDNCIDGDAIDIIKRINKISKCNIELHDISDSDSSD